MTPHLFFPLQPSLQRDTTNSPSPFAIVIEVESISGLQDLRGGVEEVYPINLLTSEEESNNLNGESNNIEQDNEGEIEDDFEVYNSEED